MNTINYGSRGPDVELLQLSLYRAGFNPGAIDGIFGNSTHTALINFQQKFGLSPDGIAGPMTWNSLLPFIRGYIKISIQRNDTLWRIANTYSTSIRAIITANPGIDANNLMTGQIITVPLGFNVIPTNISYTSHLYEQLLNGLSVRYPFLKTTIIGKSVMGKNIYSISIGSGYTQVSYNASHHANEWITTPILLKYLEEYSLAYSQGGSIYNASAINLYNKVILKMIPLVNPDGVDLVTGALNSGIYYINARTYANNYPSIPFPSGWKANISGVDLNLQYPANWDSAMEIKFAQGFTSPAPRDYVGPAPLSEPESRSMYTFTLSNDFSLILAYHTQGEIIFWRYADFNPPKSREIGLKMQQSSGYVLSETPPESAYAGYKDWFILNYNRPGYTIEAGLGSNPLPISQFDEIYNKNVGILTVGMSEI